MCGGGGPGAGEGWGRWGDEWEGAAAAVLWAGWGAVLGLQGAARCPSSPNYLFPLPPPCSHSLSFLDSFLTAPPPSPPPRACMQVPIRVVYLDRSLAPGGDMGAEGGGNGNGGNGGGGVLHVDRHDFVPEGCAPPHHPRVHLLYRPGHYVSDACPAASSSRLDCYLCCCCCCCCCCRRMTIRGAMQQLID